MPLRFRFADADATPFAVEFLLAGFIPLIDAVSAFMPLSHQHMPRVTRTLLRSFAPATICRDAAIYDSRCRTCHGWFQRLPVICRCFASRRYFRRCTLAPRYEAVAAQQRDATRHASARCLRVDIFLTRSSYYAATRHRAIAIVACLRVDVTCRYHFMLFCSYS